MDRFPRSDSIVQQTRSGLQTYMAQVYGWMTVGLLLTAFIAWYAANTPELMMFIFSSKITFFGLIIAQLALVFVLSGLVQKLSAGMATTLFMLYSALTGLTLSSIFIVYTYSSIASTFVVAVRSGALTLTLSHGRGNKHQKRQQGRRFAFISPTPSRSSLSASSPDSPAPDNTPLPAPAAGNNTACGTPAGRR